MPFRLVPLKKRVAVPREPWKVGSEGLPSLKEASGIGGWVPSPPCNEESLPQIREIADRIASRYAGGLSKLNEVQRAWRQKHDALHRRKQHPLTGGREDAILPPSARDDSGHASGAMTARDPQPESSASSVPRRSNSSNPPRRKQRIKTQKPPEIEALPLDQEPEPQEDEIKDVLKSGLGDLFHQKREVYGEDLEPGRSTLQSPGRLDLEDDEHVRPRIQGSASSEVASSRSASMSRSNNLEAIAQDVQQQKRAAPRKTALFGSKKKPFRPPAETLGEAEDDGERHGRALSFATCSELAKKHRLTVPMVRQSLEEFLSLDKNGDGRLSLAEFEQAIRDRCGIKGEEPTPMHLLHLNWSKADKDNDSEINFEEFLLWSTEHLFCEELVVADPKERYMRELARKFNFTLDQVERCYKTFCSSDSNRNGFIEEGEFRQCVANLWNCDMEDIPATRFRQFWLEADKARLGKLSFEVFLIWYMTIGVR